MFGKLRYVEWNMERRPPGKQEVLSVIDFPKFMKNSKNRAYVILDGYVPGVESLNDRSSFMPKSLTANDLEFKGVKKVEIKGPW